MTTPNTQNSWSPDYAIHPGTTLLDTLEAIEMSQKELSERTGLTPKTINEIIKGKNPITPETAIKLSSVFGTSVEFWDNLQRNYEQTLSKISRIEKLEQESKKLNYFSCYNDLEKWNFIEKVENRRDRIEKTRRLIEFFGVSSLNFIPNIYGVAYNKVKHTTKQLSQENLAAWLRCGEINASKRKPSEFDRKKLLDSLDHLRSLTLITDPKKFQQDLIETCEEFGVIVTFVPYFNNTFVCGAARWLSDTPLIQLSLRGGRADSLWFNFFHELGHILLHGKKDKFIDYDHTVKSDGEKEEEANNFAKNVLIPEKEYFRLIDQKPLNKEKVKKFAEEIGVHPGIVAGRVAYEIQDSQNIWPQIEDLTIRYSFEKKRK